MLIPPAPSSDSLTPADLIERYAQLLAANGRLKIALEYLQMIPGALRRFA